MSNSRAFQWGKSLVVCGHINDVPVGIIPSLEDSQETSSINPLLKPIVDDLDKLFDGVTFDTTEGTKNVTVYLSVAAVTSPRIEIVWVP